MLYTCIKSCFAKIGAAQTVHPDAHGDWIPDGAGRKERPETGNAPCTDRKAGCVPLPYVGSPATPRSGDARGVENNQNFARRCDSTARRPAPDLVRPAAGGPIAHTEISNDLFTTNDGNA